MAALCQIGLQRANLMLLSGAIVATTANEIINSPIAATMAAMTARISGNMAPPLQWAAGETAEPEHRGRGCPGVKPADDP